jgi:hypothetical protein
MFPNVIRIKVAEKKGKSVNLYFPIIILLILLSPILILAFPVWLFAVLFLRSSSKRQMIWLMPGALMKLICALKGTHIAVHHEDKDVVIKIL